VIRALVGLLLVASLWSVPAAAVEPLLRVRSRLRIDLEPPRRVARGLLVQGTLRDAASQEPVPGRAVAISVEGAPSFYRYAEPTREDGTFRWEVPLPPGVYHLKLAAGGDDDYAAAPPIDQSMDVSRRSPALTLEMPERVSAADPSLTITAQASERDQDGPPRPAELQVALLLDDRPLATLYLRGGRAEDVLPTAQFGPPGTQHHLRLRFAGDPLRNPATVERTLLVTTPTQLAVDATPGELRWRGRLTVTGALSDVAGPIAGQRVALWRDAAGGLEEVELGTAVSDAHGRFSLVLQGGTLPPGPQVLEVRHQPQVSWREPSRSVALPIDARPPEPWPLAWWLSPILTLALLAGVTARRRRPLARLAERKRARREAQAARTVGLTESKKGLLSTLRAAHDLGLSGQVCEHPTLRPVPGARLRVTAGAQGETRELEVDADGRYALEGLPPGPLRVEVSAPGYLSERFERALPHRGELRGARVLLVPLRARIFGVYRALALPLLPRPQLAEIWTPRELLSHVRRSSLLTDEWAALTTLVEEACFGARLPDPAVLAEVERLAGEAGGPSRAKRGGVVVS